MSGKQPPEISVIIPLFDESMSLEKLYSRLIGALKPLKKTYEIVFVDDGSKDGSYGILERIHSGDKNTKVIKLLRNFGKSVALAEGFRRSSGRIIITMDADLQDDPSEIKKFLTTLEKYDMVIGWRSKRKDRITKRFFSRIFNQMIRRILGTNVHDSNCGFKAFHREVLDNIELYSDLHRYMPTLAQQRGYTVGEVSIKHNKRLYGKSKYRSGRLIRGVLDLFMVKFLMKYTERPLHFFGSIGIIMALSGLLISLYLSLLWLGGTAIGDRPLLILGALLIITGFQFISFGLLGEMILLKGRSDKHVAKSVLE